MGKTGPKPRTWNEILEILQDNSYQDNDCFIWDGHTVSGYGTICFNGKQDYIHRLVYRYMICEELPEVVRHSCDTKRCWNPDHLLGGTHADNVNDKVSRDRHCYGKTHYNSSITEEIAHNIKHNKITKEEAIKLGASKSTYYGIKSGRIWKQA